MPNSQPTLLERALRHTERLGMANPLLVSSPGRINLIGGHSDYSGGFVLSGGADKSVLLALSPRSDDRVCIHAMDMVDTHSAPLAALAPSDLGWPNLSLGVAAQLRRLRILGGFDLLFGSDLPKGAGMSSGAAIACGTAFGLNHLLDLDLTFEQMLGAAVAAEHEFVGVRCGEADQFVNLRARENCLLMLDCRGRAFHYVPLADNGICLVLCDSQVRRNLADTEFNDRRSECERGADLLSQAEPGVGSLRDVSLDLLFQCRNALEPVVFDRCLFSLQENDRVVMMAEALTLKDFATASKLMYASHEGLRDLYGVSCPELDMLVEGAAKMPGVHGAKLMGAGFGGCTVNLVDRAHLGNFMDEMAKVFRDDLKKPPKMHIASLSKRTHVVEIA